MVCKKLFFFNPALSSILSYTKNIHWLVEPRCFFMQDFFCRDVCFILLIFSNLPIFLFLSLFLFRSWWPGRSFGHCSRVQSHSNSMSGQPAHSLLRADQFLNLFCQGCWGKSDEYHSLRLPSSFTCSILRPLRQRETASITSMLYNILKGQ